MDAPLLAIRDLRVDYDDVTAVRDVTFDVEPGMVFGLIGPNGAGKTSIMKAVATLVEPTYGSVRIAGVDVQESPREALPRLGFMPDLPPVYEDLKVREFLELFASSYGLPREERGARIGQVLEATRLAGKREALAGELSRGMRQRLFLAKTLLHDPDVFVLDEPASGLDPAARLELAGVIRDLGAAGKAVLVSSHILAEMKDFCNAVGIMEEGCMKLCGRVDQVLQELRPGRAMRVRLVRPDERLERLLSSLPLIHDVSVEETTARFQLDGDEESAAQLLRHLVHADFPLADYTAEERGLQDIFSQVSTGAVS